jgi:hypothetical protein
MTSKERAERDRNAETKSAGRVPQDRNRGGGLKWQCTVFKSEEHAEDVPDDHVKGSFAATPDWLVCKAADGRSKLVIELKTPTELRRNAMPGSHTDPKSTYVEDCEWVSESLRNKQVDNMKHVLQQAFTQLAAHVTPYAVLTDGIDFIFLKCGRAASANGQMPKSPDRNDLLRIHFYVARYHNEEEDYVEVKARASVAQCLAYVLHRSINDLDPHRWVQERYFEMLKSGREPKDSEGSSRPGTRRSQLCSVTHSACRGLQGRAHS